MEATTKGHVSLVDTHLFDSAAAAMDLDTEVLHDLHPFIRIYKSGRVERFLGTDFVPAGLDPATGVASKDVIINPSTGISARLYLPPHPADGKLPVLVYYHGGGFVIESASSPTYHNHLNVLAARAGILVVSVDYRRAPEHPLPAAYDDSWEALLWAASHAAGAVSGGEAWLAERGDFVRVFLAGDSAGANITHDVALRAAAPLGAGVSIEGLALVHPLFWASTESPLTERLWKLWSVVNPEAKSMDDPRMNPLTEEEAPRLRGLPCRRVLVTEAEKDFLRGRGRAYCEALKGSGWEGEAELLETEGEGHVFHLKNPTCEKAMAKMEVLAAFFRSGK